MYVAVVRGTDLVATEQLRAVAPSVYGIAWLYWYCRSDDPNNLHSFKVKWLVFIGWYE